MTAIARAPFTDDQVASLNAFQQERQLHPFTCIDGHGPLVASATGWACPTCSYTQDWAHSFMADWSWRVNPMGDEALDRLEALTRAWDTRSQPAEILALITRLRHAEGVIRENDAIASVQIELAQVRKLLWWRHPLRHTVAPWADEQAGTCTHTQSNPGGRPPGPQGPTMCDLCRRAIDQWNAEAIAVAGLCIHGNDPWSCGERRSADGPCNG